MQLLLSWVFIRGKGYLTLAIYHIACKERAKMTTSR